MKKSKDIVAALKEKRKERRFSLKLKWSLGTAIGVLAIFAVFATLLFQSFSSLILRQEKQYASDALSVAANHLATLENELNESNTRRELSSSIEETEQEREEPTRLYSNSVFVAFSRKNIGVGAYNLNGQKVFSSRKLPVNFNIKETDTGKVVTTGGTNVYVERRPVISKGTRKTIGYVQVTNRLLDYDNTRHKLVLIFIVFGITAAFASAILGYVLASWLLRPIDVINATINKINEAEEGDPIADIRVPEMKHQDELTDLSRLFNDMLDRMQRYIEQQQQFVEDVSHELRTPVAIIQGHLDLLNRWGKDDPQVLAESISASLQEITRMKSLVQEMLDLSRAEQVEIHFGKEVTDAREVALQVFNNFKMIHPDFVFLIDDDLKDETPVKIYRNHLEQVLIILMDNAVKYSQKRKEVHLSVSKNERYVDLAVQDFGEGIAQQDIARVFNRFYRVDKARSRDAGGNGLGLSIAQRLIEGYHGQLTVESVLGQGSVFRISLPLIIKEQKNAD
ncbi:HAMP domain-containing histidine kinase [Liquorilactobacillus satsumensis]|uniref:HAMP domain-containing sensor histidine kinase n=1 Tax=Liquorilactobacillus satsumensis TaxID=259059 RepID=UPI001E644507|nr:HAMP domain-containing histidine kinase [Liquorilactobacillus satsumensis]MCC7665536.1 two-component sensor histidine kinase [Liquorilactobacillus satsumensis]MCP9357293.1 HAMP domain-containing protein [Liquorilactobacillus satsumensis]MCP9371953.1 HAMP domain-containing protein [Liquorilactobacillus satsumensis]